MENTDRYFYKLPPYLFSELDKYTREIMDLLVKIHANQSDKDLAYNALLRSVFGYLHCQTDTQEQCIQQLYLFSKSLWNLYYDYLKDEKEKNNAL